MSTYWIPIDARHSGLTRISIVSLQRMQCVKNVQWQSHLLSNHLSNRLKLERGEQSVPLVNKVLSYICPIAAWRTRASWRSLQTWITLCWLRAEVNNGSDQLEMINNVVISEQDTLPVNHETHQIPPCHQVPVLYHMYFFSRTLYFSTCWDIK